MSRLRSAIYTFESAAGFLFREILSRTTTSDEGL